MQMRHTDFDENSKAGYVREMFTRVAANYDCMNRLITGGFDQVWRREVIRLAGIEPGMRVLDLGTGTGDLARLAQGSGAVTTAVDFTLEMMLTGREKGDLPFLTTDAECLPFESCTFDAAFSGFLVRNVADLARVLAEQWRVLKPGGRLVILDTTKPQRNLLTPAIWLHMHLVIPLLGWLISGNREAYCYLPSSSEGFLTAEDLTNRITATDFEGVGFKRYMAGTIAIHHGKKPM